MCLRPITITNNTRRFVRGLTRPMLMVGCGHCSECMKKKEDDWFVRAYFEYKCCMELGGEVWFPTLTFNEAHLPIWVDDDYDFDVQCCDPMLIRNFRAHFRQELLRKGYSIEGIRFEFVTEFGTDNGRLHHHVLIFMPYKVPESVMVECLEKAWAYKLEPMKYEKVISKGPNKGKVVNKYLRDESGNILYKKVPKNGYVMWSKKWPKTLQNERGIQYVQKYVNKPQEWIERYGINEYEQLLKDEISYWYVARQFKKTFRSQIRSFERGLYFQDYLRMLKSCESHCDLFSQDSMLRRCDAFLSKLDGPKLKEFDCSLADDEYISQRLDRAVDKLRSWRRHCPKHFQSTHFGELGIDECFKNPDGSWNIEKLVDGKINLSEHGAGVVVGEGHNDTFLYNMPFYYFRKIFFDTDEYGLDVRNDLYDKVHDLRFEQSQKVQCDSFAPYFDLSRLSEHLSPLSLGDSTVNEIYSNIEHLMSGRTIEDLVLYQTVYQGIHTDGAASVLIEQLEPLPGAPIAVDEQLHVLRDNALAYLYGQHHRELFTTPSPERFKPRERKLMRGRTWGDYPCFRDFDYILELIQDYESALDQMQDDAYFEKERNKRNILRYFPTEKYCITKF